MKPLIGDLLIRYGIITHDQLVKALEVQKTKKRRLGEILIDLGLLTSKDLIWILSEQADIPFIEVNLEMLNPDLVRRFPEQLLYKNMILPLYETNQAIFIAQGDPSDREKTLAIKAYTDKEINVSGAEPSTIERLLNSFFLVHHLDKVEQQIEEINALHINADTAHIEVINDKGQILCITGSAKISIQYISHEKKLNERKSNDGND
jgi:hypothetical protein